ncbi:PLP-dependent aminotransferase family protein [Sciscionella marina]|uniref:MocR-like pyridoxine biosynthesis transcription factor PdxR n=1 Tax=Sciscionella marina TaxID=508770 RepID=UPI0003A8FD5B|nr:PLP-dependent aminotransferase family protein [Sciscionella marina]
MAIDWSSLGVDFHLELSGNGARGAALVEAVRSAVRDGRLAAGTVLPSTRVLAAELGLARGTVTTAYRQLAAEGYLVTAQGAPTKVAAVAGKQVRPEPAPERHGRPRWNFQPGLPELSEFPRQQWLAASRTALAAMPASEPGFPDPQGHPVLRSALAAYLGRARGVLAEPERIVICGGYSHALAVLATVLRARGIGEFAFEDPSLRRYRDIAARQGVRVVPLPMDEHGARVSELDSPVLVTGAAHHYPLGVPLHPARRGELVARADVLAIEDDYDGEFRYAGPKVGALQALAPERVVYAGTVSKTLGPGLRLGWLVLPSELVEPVREEMYYGGQTTNAIDQLIFAEFLESGRYDTHIRRARAMYKARRAKVLAALEGIPVVPQGIPAGLHLLLMLPLGLSESECLGVLHGHSVAAESLQRSWFSAQGRPQGIVIGYGAPAKHAFGPALEALRTALATACR